MPSQTSRAALWSIWGDAIMEDPCDREELLLLAAIASRVLIQATTQAAQIPREDPRDSELLTAAQIAAEFGCSKWSVAQAIRSKALAAWKPREGATRGAKVPRGVAKVWAGR